MPEETTTEDEQSKRPNTPAFDSIGEAIQYVEDHALSFRNTYPLATAFQKLRDKYLGAGKKDEGNCCQIELECFSFGTFRGVVKPQSSRTNPETNQTDEFPQLEKYSDDELKYIEGRWENTKNPRLKARYGHILWASRRKHAKYANSAVDAYLLLTGEFEKREDTKPKKTARGAEILEAIQNALELGERLNYRTADIKAETLRLLKDYTFGSPNSPMLRKELIEEMLERPKLFEHNDLKLIDQIIPPLFKTLDPFRKIDALKLIARVDAKVKLGAINWKSELAVANEEVGDGFTAQNNNAALDYYLTAASLYKELRDAAKTKELEEKISTAKKNLNLTKFEESIDRSGFARERKEKAAIVVEKSSCDDLFALLSSSDDFIPNAEAVRAASESDREPLFFKRIAQGAIDHRGNPVQHFSTPEELSQFWFLKAYESELSLNTFILINEFFLAGLRAEKITAENLRKFLEERTWFNTEFKKTIGEPMSYKWIDQIMPGLEQFIGDLKVCIADGKRKPNFLSATDSLSVKVEGLLREICDAIGATTFFWKEDKLGRRIVNEQDINGLQFSPALKAHFTENDYGFSDSF